MIRAAPRVRRAGAAIIGDPARVAVIVVAALAAARLTVVVVVAGLAVVGARRLLEAIRVAAVPVGQVAVVVVRVPFGALEQHFHFRSARQPEALRHRTDRTAHQCQLGARVLDRVNFHEDRGVSKAALVFYRSAVW